MQLSSLNLPYRHFWSCSKYKLVWCQTLGTNVASLLVISRNELLMGGSGLWSHKLLCHATKHKHWMFYVYRFPIMCFNIWVPLLVCTSLFFQQSVYMYMKIIILILKFEFISGTAKYWQLNKICVGVFLSEMSFKHLHVLNVKHFNQGSVLAVMLSLPK